MNPTADAPEASIEPQPCVARIPGMTINSGEHTEIWSWETDDIPDALRALADALESDDRLLLIGFNNSPLDATEERLSIVQAIITIDFGEGDDG